MWERVLILLVVAITFTQAAKVPANAFRSGMKDYFKYGEFTPEFKQIMKMANVSHAFRTNAEEFIDGDVICALCDEVLDVLLETIRSGDITIEELQEVVVELCTLLVFESVEVCEGAVSSNIGIIWHIILARPDKHADTVCGLIGQGYGCTGTPDDWTIDIADGSSEINKGIISGEEPVKVLQLTDIHYDEIYEPGSLAPCPEPMCCTLGSVPDTPENAAGYWGDYRDCDTPLHAIEDGLEHIAATHDGIDYIYVTGDIISHRVWRTSVELNTQDMILIFDKITEYFPNIPVYPILGNHEPHPVNVFAPLEIQDESLSTQWLFDLSAELWKEWLDEGALETVRRGGFYSILARPGLRVIVLNSNVAYIQNWWLLYDDVDPYGQLQWLADTLYESEQNGEKVHILSHLPSSGGSCYTVWSREYRRITDRFAGTIAATFNGHTHYDEVLLYHSLEDPNLPIGIAWNGGSLTTASNKNPNYKLFDVDAESFEVLDFDTWAYNITAANLTPDVRPNWFKLYSFKEAYGLEGTAPSDVRSLAEAMVDDRSIIEQYFRFGHREADTALASGCNSDCLRGLLCKMLKSEYSDNTQCDELTADW